jgi:hypothetical protein
VVPVLVEAQTPAFTPEVPAEELTLQPQLTHLEQDNQGRVMLEAKEAIVHFGPVVVVVVQAQLELPQRQVKEVKVEMGEPRQSLEPEPSMPVVVVVPAETQVLREEPEAPEEVVPEALSEPALARAAPMVRTVPVVAVAVVATPITFGVTRVVQVDLVLSYFPGERG